MNFQFFIRRVPLRPNDLVSDDDVDDNNYKSDQNLPTKSRTLNTFNTLSVLQKQGKLSQKEIGQTLIPNKSSEPITDFESRVYNGKFFGSGDFYFCSSQDEIKIFNVTDPQNWECVNSFVARNVRWTITDLDISPDQSFIIYCSMGPFLTLIKLSEDPSDVVNFSADQQSVLLNSTLDNYGVFSCEVSGSGTEVLIGTRVRSLETHDLVTKRIAYRVQNAHSDDINSACFDSVGSQVIYSASDDSTIKIWDRRSSDRRPQGFLLGHREGITKVSSKGDGFHLISNGKDQCLKLWDIRKMNSLEEFREFDSRNYNSGFDYRMENYPLINYTKKMRNDSSLLTFRGHKVLSTLIRCYFSPLESTAQRYVYTGSADGNVYVYDTYTGKKAMVLKPDPNRPQMDENICRDVSWHPFNPIIAATSFDCCVHQYCYA